MCGIAGVLLERKINKKELKKFESAVAKMNKVQANRGPDDEGIFTFERGVFGHRRLSILDLSKAGHQPLEYQKSNIKNQKELCITFNGEIYNFLELKKDLEKKGYKFKTKTDTEVILALYAEYGEESFKMLRGMFAFGLWDGKKNKLFLVKDRYGIKPLYYYSDSGKLVFASTVKAVSESKLVKVEKNPDALMGFLLFGSVPLPFTTIKGIMAVPAGHYLEIDANRSKKIVKYYDPLDYFISADKKVLIDKSEAINEIKRRLKESVDLHLISDAPLGIFLSGGLDSSAIAALSVEALREGGFGRKITTLSIVFDEKEFSEKKYQRMVVDKIKSDHKEIKITKQDFQNSFDKIFDAMDQPTIDGINSFFIAEAAKKAGLKTVLSGLGGDEIFMGYPSFKKAGFLRNIQKLPLSSGFWSFSSSVFQSLFGDRYSKAEYFANNDILSFYLGVRGLFSSKETARILGANLSEVNNFIDDFYNLTLYPKSSILNSLHSANLLSYLELKFYLQNQLLKDTDFMSMYHSIEVRVPFLDHPLVEYLSSLTPDLKIGKEINKPLLAESVRDLLPQEIFTRPKMGFTFPFQKWLTDFQINKSSDNYPILGGSHWSRSWAKGVLEKFK